jgi:GGDEF domain-containing protein
LDDRLAVACLISLLTAMCLFAAAALDMMNALKSDSETDALSGLLNRRGFDLAARRLFEQGQRDCLWLSSCRSRSFQVDQRSFRP